MYTENDKAEIAHRHDYHQVMLLKIVSGIPTIDFQNCEAKNRSIHFIGLELTHLMEEPSRESFAFYPKFTSERIFYDGENTLLDLKIVDTCNYGNKMLL